MNKTKNFELLKQLVNEVDPLGLIDVDTPESLDEYDPEINEILKIDITALSQAEFGERVYQIFVKYFDQRLAGEKEKYNLIASQFLDKKDNENE